MSAIAPNPYHTSSAATSWGGPLLPPGYAQGYEGQAVGKGVVRTVEQWRGPSAYVASLFVFDVPEQSKSKRKLVVASLFALCCCVLVKAGMFQDWGTVCYPLAAMSGLVAYVL